MVIKLERDKDGSFCPIPEDKLLANFESDFVETWKHENEPATSESFLKAALEGCNI